MNKVLIILFLSVSTIAVAQDFNIVYYNSKWEVTSIKYAKYFRNSGFDPSTLTFDSIVTDHYMKGPIEMIGRYSKGIKNGQFIYYYPNQSVKLITTYTDNKRSGTWMSFYENGQIEKVVEYKEGKEILIKYNNKEGKSFLKDLTGKYSIETFYNYYFNAFSQSSLDDRSDRYLVTGKLENGFKTGLWTIKHYVPTSTRVGDGNWNTYYSSIKAFQLKFENGNFIKGWQYLSGNLRTKIDFDTLTYLIPEPEKIKITESIFNEPGQLIKQNYLIKAVIASQQKSTKQVLIESETELKDFFYSNYSHYAQNCSDTIRMTIGLKFDDQGKISVSSISPHIGTGFEKEVYRVIGLISKVKIHSQSIYILNYRVLCVDELDFKK
jgi:antitoxin component YwqK of YwqJK toxin-antitoxin module